MNNPRMGIEVDFVDFSDNSAMLSKMLSDGDKTKLVWLETPTNPALKVTDIEKVSTFTKRFNARTLLAIDNTLCSPHFQNPLEQGAWQGNLHVRESTRSKQSHTITHAFHRCRYCGPLCVRIHQWPFGCGHGRCVYEQQGSLRAASFHSELRRCSPIAL